MAEVMIALTVAQTAAALATTYIGGKQADAAAKYEAEALRQKAGQERAVSQMKASEEQYKANRLMARQRAIAAASGSGLTNDSSFNTIIDATHRKGRFNSDLELWQGETNARGLESKAGAILTENRNRKNAMPLQYASTIIKGATQAYGIGSDAGYWKPPADAGWITETRDASGNLMSIDGPTGSKYSYKTLG